MSRKSTKNFEKWLKKATLLDDLFFNIALKRFPELTEMLISLFSPIKIIGDYKVEADYKTFDMGLRFELDSLTVDSVGTHFVVEMQNVHDSLIAERFASYVDHAREKH